ncbi:MAG: 2-phospho-L-lactate transferase [Actinomycetota bacterium]|nr:2-phospho-L-lactate transferase [Actinomycetota bacterium]
MKVTALAGGAGAAKFLDGLAAAMDPRALTIIGNTGDDTVMHGLHISPDLDIVTYTLAGIVDEVGWGIRGDTTHALDQMAAYGVDAWFTLKDRDLGTHLARTTWLAEGAPLSEVTDRIRRALGVPSAILPVSDDPVRTRILTEEGAERQFQEYFVRFGHRERVQAIRYEGADASAPAPGVVESIEEAGRIIICPSNPALSIGPILSVPGIRKLLSERREDVWAISPIVGGRALKGPAADLMRALGAERSAFGVGSVYEDFCGTLVIDNVDRSYADRIRTLGVEPVVADTIMRDRAEAAALARLIISP